MGVQIVHSIFSFRYQFSCAQGVSNLIKGNHTAHLFTSGLVPGIDCFVHKVQEFGARKVKEPNDSAELLKNEHTVC